MAEGSGSGGNGALYFVVGGLVVAVGIGAFVYSGGYLGGHGSRTTTEHTTVSAPAPTATAPAPPATTTTTTTEKTRN